MNKPIVSLAATLLIGIMSPAAAAHGPAHRDGHRFVERAHHLDRAHHRRELRREFRRDLRRANRRALRNHRDCHRRWHRRHRVLHHPRGHRCRLGHRHYHRGVAYYGDLERIVLGAVAYGIVREALD